jgi:hypothetical protein
LPTKAHNLKGIATSGIQAGGISLSTHFQVLFLIYPLNYFLKIARTNGPSLLGKQRHKLTGVVLWIFLLSFAPAYIYFKADTLCRTRIFCTVAKLQNRKQKERSARKTLRPTAPERDEIRVYETPSGVTARWHPLTHAKQGVR